MLQNQFIESAIDSILSHNKSGKPIEIDEVYLRKIGLNDEQLARLKRGDAKDLYYK